MVPWQGAGINQSPNEPRSGGAFWFLQPADGGVGANPVVALDPDRLIPYTLAPVSHGNAGNCRRPERADRSGLGGTMAINPHYHMNHSSFEFEDLLACGRGELFGPGNPQLPLPNMLMLDRITQIDDTGGAHNKGQIVAELDIHPDLWFFKCHFEHDPVMPGCLGLDAMWQLVGFFLGWKGGQGRGRALGAGDVKFTGQVLPTAKRVTYRIDMKRVIMRRLTMGIADASLDVDGDVIYTASDLRVGLFEAPDAMNKK